MDGSSRAIVIRRLKTDCVRKKLAKAALLANIREALEEVKLYKQGKIQLQSMRDFLAELDDE